MDVGLMLRGIAIGFSIAVPVGPIGVLCIRRTLAEGRAYGIVSGLGAATADALYGAIAGFGITAISTMLINQQMWLRLIGGLFLCYLGLKTMLAAPAQEAAPANSYGLAGAYASTLLLTLTNPLTILSFAAIFAGLGVGTSTDSYLGAMLLVLGVFTGSALWWLLLSSGISVFRGAFNPARLRWTNRISGLIILGFGLLALVG
ncbi:MAG: lysine transporter LysE [Herpetosiphonaceae bacterium]|nr:MAG: lysine transporter LysE [Herpetosiphonaceae bacterium]